MTDSSVPARLPDGPAASAPALYGQEEIRAAVSMEQAIPAVRRAFLATAGGDLVNPLPWSLDIPGRGETHVKGAYIGGSEYYVVKMSTGFPGNARRGLPTSDGFSGAFDAATGRLRALLLDGGHLTELRAGAAGGLALDVLGPPEVETVTVFGSGGQARFQVDGILAVRSPSRWLLVGRDPERAEEFARWVRARVAAGGRGGTVEVVAAGGAEAAVRASQAVVTVTTSATPLLEAGWVGEGTHVTAVGSDSPEKRELPPGLLAAASAVVVDDLAQSAVLGELKGVDQATLNRPAVTLGFVLAGREPGRRGPADITVADLSGLGAQDAAIAEVALANLGA